MNKKLVIKELCATHDGSVMVASKWVIIYLFSLTIEYV